MSGAARIVWIYKDFFWLINQNPYTGASDIYGHGDFFHFAKNFNRISGAMIGSFFILGAGLTIIKVVRKKGSLFELMILLGGFFLFFSFHISYFITISTIRMNYDVC